MTIQAMVFFYLSRNQPSPYLKEEKGQGNPEVYSEEVGLNILKKPKGEGGTKRIEKRVLSFSKIRAKGKPRLPNARTMERYLKRQFPHKRMGSKSVH